MITKFFIVIEPPECCSWQQQVLRASRSNGFQVADSLVAVCRPTAVIFTALGNVNPAFGVVAGAPSDRGSAESAPGGDRIWSSYHVGLPSWNWIEMTPTIC